MSEQRRTAAAGEPDEAGDNGSNRDGGLRAPTSIRRLVHVAPFWARWTDLDAACDAYRGLIARLGAQPPAGSAGSAHFIHDVERESADRLLADKLDAAGADRRHLYPVWRWLTQDVRDRSDGWIDARHAEPHARACELVGEGLRRCQELHRRLTPERYELLVDQINLFSVRFFFDHAHFDRFLDEAGVSDADADVDTATPYYVCLDLRFDIRADAYWTCATLSLWSDWPQHQHIAPQDTGHRTRAVDAPRRSPQLAALRRRFDDVTHRFECFVHGPEVVGGPPQADDDTDHLRWSRPRLEVFDVGYGSPRFWFAVADQRPTSPPEYLTDQDRFESFLGEVGEAFLEVTDPRSDTIAAALVHGEYLVQRRPIHDRHGTTSVGDEPTYLLLPRHGEPRAQEDRGYRIVRSLLELEWHAATVLYDVDSDLEVARTHVVMYERNALRAAVLLDALVLHLPGTSGEDLRLVHESIDLVHQTLLQGVADLARTATIIQESRRRVGDGANELVARFDQALDQQSIDGRLDIRASLAKQGLFDRLQERAKDDMAVAERVQTRYESLLQEITMAFEERRVREADQLEHYSGWIALIFGVVGVVTVLEAVLDFRLNEPWWLVVWGTRIGAAPVIAVLIWVIFRGMRQYRRVGKLSTDSFRERYRDTWSFLAMTSTDALERLRTHVESHNDRAARAELWNHADQRFSRELARLWDRPAEQPRNPTPRHWWQRLPWPGRRGATGAIAATADVVPEGRLVQQEEIHRLAARVETFVCEALLVSERTPQLHDFALPRLTCLYRLLSASGERPRVGTVPKLVSDFDLRTSLVKAGIPEDRWETFLVWEEEQLADAAAAGVRLDATRILERLEAIGVRNGLDAAAADRVVGKMWAYVHAWRRTASPHPHP